ncbi:uncharacterized protein LOC135137470 isoform X2 [Zophobas morio]|uniref:uncharacterized protein LOC135137470 isoform X2 n=1 Tax=Zophobas morio TaxID=2755281 RepID=UPI0030835C56
MEATTFHKRSGTTDRGKEYEDYVTASLALNLIQNEDVENFQIASNDDNFGKFDDVIIETKLMNQDVMKYAVQLKHSEKKSTLIPKRLTDSKGDFSIKKYLDSFREKEQNFGDYKLILWTNLKLDWSCSELLIIDSLNLQLDIEKYEKDDMKLIFDYPEETNCYKFKIVDNGSFPANDELDSYRSFFDKFFLFTNQDNVERAKKKTVERFCQKFNCKDTYAKKFLEYITEWSKGTGTKEKLNKSTMQTFTALNLLESHIRPYVKDSSNDKTKLLQEAINSFDITVFDDCFVDEVVKLWGDLEEDDATKKEVLKTRKKFQLKNDETARSVTFWLGDQCPLIMVQNEFAAEAIKLCPGKKFIVLEKTPFLLPGFAIFRHLSDLKRNEKLTTNLKCCLQSREHSLEHLIQQNEEIENIVTTNELLQMVNGSYRIEEQSQALAEPYINRRLSKIYIDCKFLDSIDKNTLVVISNACVKNIKKYLGSSKIRYVFAENYLKDPNQKQIVKEKMPNIFRIKKTRFRIAEDVYSYGNESEKINVFINEKECSMHQFNEICKKNPDAKSCHHLRMNNEYLEWIESKNNVTDIQNFLLESQDFSDESEFYTVESVNNINIIVADPGMGKSELLRSFQKNFTNNLWRLIITRKDMSEYCKDSSINKNVESFINFILEAKYSLKTFHRNFVNAAFMKGQVVLLWDALDEISNEHLEHILQIIKDFTKENFEQWITCRSHLKKKIETKLKTLSRKIDTFSQQEEIEYVTKRLEKVCSSNELQEITKGIQTNIRFVKMSDILGNALYLYIFSELLLRNKDNIASLFSKSLCITDLYELFINETFSERFNEKATSSRDENINKMAKESRIRNYGEAAAETLFGKKLLRMYINNDKFFKDLATEGDRFGFISEIPEDPQQILFIHHTFAEYFAAMYFSSQIDRFKDFLKDIIFEEKYLNVRFFFDMLLAKNSPAHLATLNANLEDLEDCDINSKDSGGRNILQIASSWGGRFPILNVEKENGGYVIDDENVPCIDNESPEYKLMLEYIVNILDEGIIEERNDLFELTCLDYAERCSCIYAIAMIGKTQHTLTLRSEDYKFHASLLYYSVLLGHDGVIYLLKEGMIYVRNKEGQSLLHLASTHGQDECVKQLLSTNIYKERIDELNDDNATPLYLACSRGKVKVVEVLLEAGAQPVVNNSENPLFISCSRGAYEIVELLINLGTDVNCEDQYGRTPIFSAIFNQHQHIVELLIHSGADCNKTDKQNQTPLHISCRFGMTELVEILLKCGATHNVFDKDDWTPLHFAALNGHDETVKSLLNQGANANRCNINGETPLHLASAENFSDVASQLITFGAKIDSVDKIWQTPLHLAARNGHVSIIKLLISNGSDVDCEDTSGQTPLHLACRRGNHRCVETLIQWGADKDACDNKKQTALYFTAQSGDFKTTQLLIESNADVNICNKFGTSPLIEACCWGYLNIVELLVDKEADVEAKNFNGLTPFGSAYHNGHNEIVNFLEDRGAATFLKNTPTTTPLHVFCKKNYVAGVKRLLNMGVSTEGVDCYGWSAIHWACCKGYVEILTMLLNSGANINAITGDHQTALDIARMNNQQRIIEALFLHEQR